MASGYERRAASGLAGGMQSLALPRARAGSRRAADAAARPRPLRAGGRELRRPQLPLPCPSPSPSSPLGSGKTTLLNYLCATSASSSSARWSTSLAIDIDSSLLAAAAALTDGVVELSNGCVCCTINGSLVDALRTMLGRRARLDHLLLETTGLADPRPVLDTLRLPEFAASVRLDAVLTVVDASHVADDEPDAALRTAAGAQQLACADLVVLSKTDLLSGAHGAPALARARAAAKRLAPRSSSTGARPLPPELLSASASRAPPSRARCGRRRRAPPPARAAAARRRTRRRTLCSSRSSRSARPPRRSRRRAPMAMAGVLGPSACGSPRRRLLADAPGVRRAP